MNYYYEKGFGVFEMIGQVKAKVLKPCPTCGVYSELKLKKNVPALFCDDCASRSKSDELPGPVQETNT